MRRVIEDFNPESFEDRLNLQKYVYIARFFGMDLGYEFSLYLHGPYSPELADDYFGGNFSKCGSLEFNEKFAELVRGKDGDWLELASTILMIKERYNFDEERIIQGVLNVKYWANESELRKIIGELKEAGIF